MENSIRLNNGVEMPLAGFGTYRIPPRMTGRCVEEALSAGYRLIDTAQCYGNEKETGDAIRSSGIGRNSVFVTTKLWGCRGYEDTLASADRSAKLLGGFIDLLLIHEPSGNITEIYRGMERALEEGKARSIGLSNFYGGDYLAVIAGCRTVPAVDQIETHVFRQQRKTECLLSRHGTRLASWSPLACGRNDIFRNHALVEIAAAHGKSAAQVALRWLVQRGVPVCPKTTRPERMAENLGIFDFALTGQEMDSIAALDENRSLFGWW